MLEIRIDIVPFGQESRRCTLEKIQIINTVDHPRRPEYGNYIVQTDNEEGRHPRVACRIKGHRRDRGYWPLIRKAIKALDSK